MVQGLVAGLHWPLAWQLLGGRDVIQYTPFEVLYSSSVAWPFRQVLSSRVLFKDIILELCCL